MTGMAEFLRTSDFTSSAWRLQLFKDEALRLRLAISATTRAPRSGEKDGVHYWFIQMDDFNKKIENNEFIEWNEHFSNKYGTLKSEMTRIHSEGNVPFLEIETEGAKNVIDMFSENNRLKKDSKR